jgi:hypothetical protein
MVDSRDMATGALLLPPNFALLSLVEFFIYLSGIIIVLK